MLKKRKSRTRGVSNESWTVLSCPSLTARLHSLVLIFPFLLGYSAVFFFFFWTRHQFRHSSILALKTSRLSKGGRGGGGGSLTPQTVDKG